MYQQKRCNPTALGGRLSYHEATEKPVVKPVANRNAGYPEERTGIGACQYMEGNVVHLYTTVVNLSANLQPALTLYVSSGVRESVVRRE